MLHTLQRKEGISAAFYSLWRNWAIAVGCLAVFTFITPLVKQSWATPIALVLLALLLTIRHEMNKQPIPVCLRLYSQVSLVLLFSAIVIYSRFIFPHGEDMFELTGQPCNLNGPILGLLVTGPLSTIIPALYLLRRSRPAISRCYQKGKEDVIENGFLDRLYQREWRFLTKLLLGLSIGLSIASWGYYLFHYINVNLNRSDRFIFIWLPLTAYVVSLIYLGGRYYWMWVYYTLKEGKDQIEAPSTTTLRFLVIADDKILLDILPTGKTHPNGQEIKKFDTPAIYNLTYSEKMTDSRASEILANATGLHGVKIKKIYSSPDQITYHNVFHYFAFLDATRDIVDSKLRGEWMTLGELRQLMAMNLTSTPLNFELERIYKVSMAWKTYDRAGRRLYKIKHYRPTFRLKDLSKWDVDYDDRRWLEICRNNQDKWLYPLYRLRDYLRNVQNKLSVV